MHPIPATHSARLWKLVVESPFTFTCKYRLQNSKGFCKNYSAVALLLNQPDEADLPSVLAHSKEYVSTGVHVTAVALQETGKHVKAHTTLPEHNSSPNTQATKPHLKGPNRSWAHKSLFLLLLTFYLWGPANVYVLLPNVKKGERVKEIKTKSRLHDA